MDADAAALPGAAVGAHRARGRARPRTATGSRCGSTSRPAGCGSTCASSRTGARRATSTARTRAAARSARRRSRSRTRCRSATTRCGARSTDAAGEVHEAAMALIVTPSWLGLAGRGRRAPRLGHRHAALQRPVARSPGASATSSTSRTWPSGPPPRPAPTTCWSTRCTPPSRWRRSSPRPTCRPRAASPTRSTCGSSASPSTRPRRTRCGPRSTGSAPTLAARARRARRHRPRRHLDGQARGAAGPVRGAAHARPRGGVRRLPARARATGCGTSPTWSALADRARPRLRRPGPPSCGTPASPGGAGVGRGSTPTRSTSSAGCSGCSTSSSTRPSRPRCAPGWRSASCTTSPSA